MLRQPSLYTALRIRCQQKCVRCFASKADRPKQSLSESKFSDSMAFRGRTPRQTPASQIPDLGDYYDTIDYRGKKNLSRLIGLVAFCVYFFILREENDLDAMLYQPPWVIVPQIERGVVKQKIARAKLAGESTAELEKTLADLDQKEDRLKEQWRLQEEKRTSW